MLNYSQTIPANVSYNEYQFVIVQARSDGFVEKVYPMTIGDHVKKGRHLSILPFRTGWKHRVNSFCYPAPVMLPRRSGTASRRYAGRGYSETAFCRSIQTRFTIKAPIDGVITAFDLRTGMNISKDKVVAQIQEWTRSGSALQCQNLSPIC
ncbi:Cation efflux system protein CusB [Escherichia coli]|nr:Cation efflux system protein CusB [Escherichia coli]